MKLTVDKLHITLDRNPSLRDAILEARKGDIVSLVGPNGSGKSTLLRTVYRSLRSADEWSGSARTTCGHCPRAPPPPYGRRPPGRRRQHHRPDRHRDRGVGRAPHHGPLGRDVPEDNRAVSDAIDRCGVRPFPDRDDASLSGGERQRVLLARALAQDPQLPVLDELTNHLDIQARFELLDLIRATGFTTLAVFHDLDLAARPLRPPGRTAERIRCGGGPGPGGAHLGPPRRRRRPDHLRGFPPSRMTTVRGTTAPAPPPAPWSAEPVPGRRWRSRELPSPLRALTSSVSCGTRPKRSPTTP
ncbi:MAG: ABC transporter ATP-binding protein [Streptomyces sp.]|nr:ABC transporter ATP-binding protein [Streptomyces sp.]